MIKKILLASVLSAVLLPVSPVKAQWQTNGSNVYYNNGNVGIGTSSPLGLFEVYGVNSPLSRITWTNSNSFGRLTFGQGSTQIGTLQAIGTNFSDSSRNGNLDLIDWYSGGDVTVWTNNGTVSEKMRVTADGKLSVGTSSPPGTAKIYTNGALGGYCSTGAVEYYTVNALGWYDVPVSATGCNWDTQRTRFTLTQDNSGSGDVSIISLRIKKNSITSNSFTIQFYVNAVPTPGSARFYWMALQQ